MNIAYDIVVATTSIGGLSFYPISIWILDAATSNFSVTLAVVNRMAMTLACAYVIAALLTLFKNRRRIIAATPQLKIAGNEFYTITEQEKKDDKIGRFLTDERLTHFNSIINQFLLERKPFLQQKYSLRDLADDVDIPVNYLSAFINRYHKVNYSDFINGYRVSHAREMIMDGEWKRKTLEAIAAESGFNNRNTFTAAFRKETGQSPSEFLKVVKKNYIGNRSSSNKTKRILV